jgi:Protein of unknown function (DUF3467)
MTENAETGNDPAPTKRPVQRITPENMQAVYANNVSMAISQWDISFAFGLLLDATENRIVVRDSVSVVMSPQHAKVFSQVLDRNIAIFEKQFGTLPFSADPEDETSESG